MQAKHITWKGSISMNLEVLYKQFSGNDSFKTPEDRKSVYLEALEKTYPGILCSISQCMTAKLTGDPYEDEGFYATKMKESDYPWWIITSSADTDGLIALFYPGAMERLAMVLGESYYVGCAGDDRAILIGESFMSLERFQNLCRKKYQGKGYFYNAETKIFMSVKE